MGKYMKKPKLTSTTPTPGVLTRAKTLAIQTLRSPDDADYCYLHLRSRRLHKPSLLPDPRVKQTRKENPTAHWASGSVGSAHENFNRLDHQFGETESMGRGARENTPCSFNMDVETTVPPSSSTRGLLSSAPYQKEQNLVPMNIPSKHEIDEFFAFTELQQELLFIERYNFDIRNDIPLSGRYEWVKVDQ